MLDTFTWIPELIGRLHPMLVHIPIGLLVGALLLEGWSWWKKDNSLQRGIHAMVWLGAASMLLALLAGLLLADRGDYGGETLQWHRNGGIVTALLALLTVALIRRKAALRWYRLALLACVVSLTLTGHQGASLTHGADYLASAFAPEAEKTPETAAMLASLRQSGSFLSEFLTWADD